MTRSPKRLLGALSLALSALGAQAGQLTVYSSAGADVLKIYADQFAKSHPTIKVNWVRDSTGIMQAKLLAEKDNPRAGEADLILAKQRNGPTGTVTVAFQGHYSRFQDMPSGH